jgi:hypothetical protein
MSLGEIKEHAAALSSEDRLQLVAFLAELDEQQEHKFQQSVDRRMKAMDAGKKVDMDIFEAEHTRRKAAQGQ